MGCSSFPESNTSARLDSSDKQQASVNVHLLLPPLRWYRSSVAVVSIQLDSSDYKDELEMELMEVLTPPAVELTCRRELFPWLVE